MAGEFVGPPQYGPVQYAPGVVVTPNPPPGAQALPLAPAPTLFGKLQSLPKPVLIGGALILAYAVLVSMRSR